MTPSNQRALQLEQDTAQLVRGSITPGSGNRRVKGDVDCSFARIECKYRNYGPGVYRFDLDWLETISTYARAESKIPVLMLEFSGGVRGALVPWDGPITRIDSRRQPALSIQGGEQECVTYTACAGPFKTWKLLTWSEFAGWVEQQREPVGETNVAPWGKQSNSWGHQSSGSWNSQPFPKKESKW